MPIAFGGSRREPLPFVRGIVALFSVALAAACTASGGGSEEAAATKVPPRATPTIVPDHAADAALDVTLYVEEHEGQARAGEPVRSGVPIPRAAGITDAATFRIVDEAGAPVLAQFEVTSRWGGPPDDESKPIKWVLVSFLADVGAGASATFRLQSFPEAREDAPGANESLVVADDAERVVVDTGAARFTLSRTRFNLFDRVELADGTVVTTGSPSGGVYLRAPGGATYFAALGTSHVEVEEQGPVEVVVVARGKHETTAGQPRLDYTIRMRFWRDRPDVMVSYTFTERDLGSIRSYVAVDEVGIEIPADVGTSARWVIGTADGSKAGSLGAEAWQRQTGRLSAAMSATFDPGNADTITYTNGGAASGSGGKAPGWISMEGERAVVTAALRWYWQQYPKKLRAKPGLLGVELWPSEDVDMRVYAASQKTHEILFAFHPRRTSGESVGRALAARLARPLVARCNPSWYAKTRVWNRIGVADLGAYPPENREFVRAVYENLLEVEYPVTFVDRAWDSWGDGHVYSMWDFGDGREGQCCSNMAYDTPRSLFLHWAMTGERALLESGLQAALHLRDVDIEHSPKDTRAGIRPGRGVPKPWLGRTRYNPVTGPQAHDLGYEGSTGYGFEHHKGQSLADHWFLTGDRLSKEVLAESYHYYEQWLEDAKTDYHRRTGNTRVVSHMLLVLLGYYDAYGTDEARARIDYVVGYLNEWQRWTSQRDPNGWIWTGRLDDNTAEFQNAVTGEALMLYETMFPDGIPVRDNLVDAARWSIDTRNRLLVNGPQGKYFNAWIGNNYGVQHATVLDPMMGAMLGYAYGATGERVFADVAIEVTLNSFEQDTSKPYVKAFTQQTRLLPAFLHWLQTPEAQVEAGRSGFTE